jgi:hypothetical protein
MKKLTSLSFAALLPLTAAVVFAQQGPKPKIAEAQARATALALVPGGKVQAHELETEDGTLIYSYEIKVAGKSGIEEVNVDAMTGKVVAREHESPADEKAEARKDKQAQAEVGESEESGEHGGAAEAE